MKCNICDCDQFKPGPKNRLSATNMRPCCNNCGSLERQRIRRRIYRACPISFFSTRRLLQLGDDNSLETKWFLSVERLTLERSLLLGREPLPLASGWIDFIAMSTLLEYIPDARAALKEACRLLSPRGVLQLHFANHKSRDRTEDVRPVPSNGGVLQYFGKDVLHYFKDVLHDMTVLAIDEVDPVTGTSEQVHLAFNFRRDADEILYALKTLTNANVEVIHITKEMANPVTAASRKVLSPDIVTTPMKTDADPFSPLLDELNKWSSTGRICKFWWRDDDLQRVTPALEMLSNLSHEFSAPVLVAVIPGNADVNLAKETADMSTLVFCQHGFMHINHESNTSLKSEFGASRHIKDIELDLINGKNRMKELFRGRFFEVFVPPWNTISNEAIPLLKYLDYIGISLFAEMESDNKTPLTITNTHIDIANWSTAPKVKCYPTPILISQLVNRLKFQRLKFDTDTDPVGILTHHKAMHEDSFSFMRQLLTATQSYDFVKWLSPQEIFVKK